MKLIEFHDVFLYFNVTRDTEKEKEETECYTTNTS